MHRDFCKELGNPYFSDEDEKRAVKQSTFWEGEEDDNFKNFGKSIRRPIDESFWKNNGYDLQGLDK